MNSNWRRSVTMLILSVVFCFGVLFMLIPVKAEESYDVSESELPVQIKKVWMHIPQSDRTRNSFEVAEGSKIELEGKDLYVYYIHEICERYYPIIDPILVQAVMQSESNYIPTVRSHCGAVGSMQVLPKYHAWRMNKYGLTDIWDPYTNIIVGTDFLNESYIKYGSYYKALRAYGGTDKYARYVLSLADQIRQGGG